MQARRAWNSTVRQYLARNIHGVDSPLQVVNRYPDHPDLVRWRAVKGDYDIQRVAVWESDYLVNDVCAWVADYRGLVWVEHEALGARLSAAAGIPYFGGGDAAASAIATHVGPAVLSIRAHATGRNLQDRYCANLVTVPMSGGLDWEQLLGRTYRHGQSQTTTVDVYLLTEATVRAMTKALNDADALSHTQGVQRLQLAYLDLPDEVFEKEEV